MNHQYFTCTGFGGTGSSVLSDLMREFLNVKSCGADFEMTIAFDFGGISDLHHYLVEDVERNKASEGIWLFKRYIAYIQKKYQHRFGDNFIDLMNEYVNSLVEVEWNGENYMQHYRYNKLQRWYYYAFPQKIQRRLREMFPAKDSYERTDKFKHYLPMQFPVTEEKFIQSTRKMFKTLLDSFDENNEYEYLCFDQLLPVYNFKRYLNYFPDLKAVVIDRDPRDLYLLNELYWHEGWIPSTDIDLYIKWFAALRRNLKSDIESADGKVKLFRFEDFIYKYDETVDSLIDFLQLDKSGHQEVQKFFNPNKSIVNTRLWEKNQTKSQQIKQIEESLQSYCYKY